jgi:uncharacterized coiled-coil DUF342 family protein
MELSIPIIISLSAFLMSVGSLVFKSGSDKKELQTLNEESKDLKSKTGRLEEAVNHIQNRQATNHERIVSIVQNADSVSTRLLKIKEENESLKIAVAKIEVLFERISSDLSEIKQSLKK